MLYALFEAVDQGSIHIILLDQFVNGDNNFIVISDKIIFDHTWFDLIWVHIQRSSNSLGAYITAHSQTIAQHRASMDDTMDDTHSIYPISLTW